MPESKNKGGRPSKADLAARELNGRVGRPGKYTQGAVLANAFRKLSDLSGPAFRRLEAAVNDPNDPQHPWATQFVLERIATRKTFEAIAEREFGQTGGSAQPRVTIVINGGSPSVETLDHTPHDVIDADVGGN